MTTKPERAIVPVPAQTPAKPYLDSADIVIIGNGIAGLTSAVEARRYQNWLDLGLKLFIIPSLKSQGVNPTNLVTFMLYNVTMFNGSPSVPTSGKV